MILLWLFQTTECTPTVIRNIAAAAYGWKSILSASDNDLKIIDQYIIRAEPD